MDERQQTWAACLTPPGRAAIATLGIRGPDSWSAACQLFQPARGQLPARPEAGQFWFGRLGKERGERDEVVLSVRRGGSAPWIDVHCHGGPELVGMLLEIFAARGIPACSWQELEARTGGDPLRVLAQAALAEAPTVRTAAILLDQFHGAFAAALARIHEALAASRLTEAEQELTALAAHVPLGRHLTKPWRVVVAGTANVGKSSLINALAGYQRSLVDAAPGTTRDVVTTLTAIDGWPVELADTAGWRLDAGPLERQGLGLARDAIAGADRCLWVLDGSVIPIFPETPTTRLHYVVNKTDLTPAWNWDDVPQALRLSAKTGAGIRELCQAISYWLVPVPPAAGAALPFTPELCDHIETAQRCLAKGLASEAMAALVTSGNCRVP